MKVQHCLLVGLSLAWFSLGCGEESPEAVGSIRQAVNICDETVPEDHFVDGIPAYAQCSETSGAIWSNNGVDTSASSLGSDSVRTQFSGGYQCTEYAYRYLYFRWGIDYRGGNGGEWCDGNPPDTLVANTTAVHGDLIVFAPGSCGADLVYGHIAVVDSVNAAQESVTFVEQNGANRRSCPINTANCFLHVVANDGQTGTGGAGGEGGGPAEGGSGGSPLPGCSDGVQNQDETSIDCGGSRCPPCSDGAPCVVAADCVSGVCDGGTCGCRDGLTGCAGACVDVSSDAANCGACGYRCAPGTACSLGVCSARCASGLTLCGQECVDTSSSLAHCGGCDAVCAVPAAVGACVAGTCTLASCEPGAVDLDQDPSNGCEYACQPTGAETCNGRDDDCNGVVDDAGACVGSGGTGGASGNPGIGGVGAAGTGGDGIPTDLGGAPAGGAGAGGSGGGNVATGGLDAASESGGTQTGGAAPAGPLGAGESGVDPNSSEPSAEDSGCGCAAAGSPQRPAAPLASLLAALLLLRRWRMRGTD